MGLQTGGPGYNARCLRVHTEHVLVKSAGPKVLWAESRVQSTGEYFPPPSVTCLNCGGGRSVVSPSINPSGISPS
ncbi:hypothetical protein TNCV_199781 [Trichonephila clavipes]|nr:hypothetical protein TNCV_199781 [Trichonephila clavipes]